MNPKLKPHEVLMQSSRALIHSENSMKSNPGKKKFGPTLSFNEVVKKYELNAAKFRNALRWAEDNPPAAVLAFANKGAGQNTYYDRAAITKWVERNLEKLK